MSPEIIIQPVDSSTFESQTTYLTQDDTIISSFYLDIKFNSISDYVETNIYDENQNPLLNSITPKSDFSVLNNDIILNPDQNLTQSGFDQGSYYIKYNFFRKVLKSDNNSLYYISEINSDRKEIRLSSNQISDSDIIFSTTLFSQLRDSATYFVDFYLNFGENDLCIANNVKLDTTQNNPSILIKLYEPLSLNHNLKDTLWVVEPISDSQTYLVTFPDPIIEINDSQYIQGPNFSLDIKNQTGLSSQIYSYNDLIGTNISGSQQQIKNILNKKGIDINLDYNDFSNFIHFSSATSRLENFYYKVSLIEDYSNEISDFIGSISGNTTSSISYNSSYNSLSGSIDSIINNFDEYEYFLYFNSGSINSWPKQNSQPPYQLYSTGSSQVSVWFENILEQASIYDQNNQDWLYWTIPEYLRNDSENKNYEVFLNMIGQHFDSIWVYIESISNRFNADNRLNYGISKTLLADALKDFGIKLYSNNFNINDLYTSFLGITPSGSLFPFPDITSTLPATSGFEFIDTKISSSNSEVIPLDDLNKKIYKRLYHNIPYLVKTKGTIAGLRSLVNIYGIPDTILRINEFGGKDRNNSGDWDYKQNIFNYSYSGSLTTGFLSNPNLGDTLPETIQFRFKTNGVPISGSQELFLSSDGGTQVSSIIIDYSNLGSLNGSYSGSIDEYNQYGIVKYIPDVNNSSKSASIYLPIFNNDWWNIQANFDHFSLTASLYIANKIDGKVGFKASDSISDSFISYFSYSPTTSSLIQFNGQFQEYRLYNTVISESIFYDYVLNPLSCEGNSINSTPDELYFRAPLGSNLDLDSRTSIHPKVTGSWIPTASFNNESEFYLSSGSFVSNIEKIYYDQPIAGIKNAVTDKINIEESVLPEGDTLSPFRSIQQQSFVSSSYTPDINYLEVAFSPQDQINEDIMSQIGYINIGDYIGDPRQINNDGNTYPDLNKLRDDYFQKYKHNYNVKDFIRLIKYFDNSLFKMLKDFVPAKTDLATGIVIKQHILERNKQKPVQVSYEDVTYTSSMKNLPNNYEEGELLYTTEGGSGGSFSHISVDSQQWSQSIHFPYKPTSSANDAIKIADNREFYNGELPGSSLYTQMTEHCGKYKAGDTTGFDHDFDCQPNLNNVEKSRENPNLQDVDYSFGIDVPVNIGLIISGSATKGTVPESNYSLKRHKGPRYDGSKSSSDGVNLSTGLTGSYDNYPPVESKKTHFAYISEIKDPYPVVNNKTYLNVKYIVDTETNIDNPGLSDVTFYNMKDVFVPTETINSSLIIPKAEPQFNKLNKTQNISHIGEIAVPILYSQISSDNYSTNLHFSSSLSIPLTYWDYTTTATSSLSNIDDNSTLFSFIPDYSVNINYVNDKLYVDPYNYYSPLYNTERVSLSNVILSEDQYSLTYNHILITSPIGNTTGITGSLDISIRHRNAGSPTSGKIPITLLKGKITFNCLNNDEFTYDIIDVLGSDFTISANNINISYSNSNYNSFIISHGIVDINYLTWDIQIKDAGTIQPTLVPGAEWCGLEFNSKDTDITFNPYSVISNKSHSFLELLNITNLYVQPDDLNIYRETGYNNKIYIDNQYMILSYDQGYIQTPIPYTSSFSNRFKNNFEPYGTEFPKIKDQWKLEIGDQIRFENNEEKCYEITDINPFYFDVYGVGPVILITLDRDISTSTNLNFFLIRRWEENRNNITVNQTFPYSNQLISASLAPTTTGFIFPKYPVDAIAKNPDKIIRDLIDKKIIE